MVPGIQIFFAASLFDIPFSMASKADTKESFDQVSLVFFFGTRASKQCKQQMYLRMRYYRAVRGK